VHFAASHPFLDHDGPLPIVHRGGALEARENTLSAFELAVSAGFRYIETDVRVTADGVLVAFHDATLGRVTDRDGRIAELPWSEVTQARIGGREPIPRLSELLEAFPDVRFNLDAKEDATLRPLARLLRRPGLLDRVCLASFSDRRLRWLRTAMGPGACTALGPAEIFRLKRAAQTGRGSPLPWLAPTALAAQVPVGPALLPLVDGRFVRAAHANGLAVHAWTIDDEADMDRLLDLGVDGIMTDRPGRLKAVLVRRAQWPGSPPAEGLSARR
jgi:glycerophosphoryl diester phosphodiesterase